MGRVQESLEVFQVPVAGVDRSVVGDIVAVVTQRRREERHQPDGGDAEFLQVIQLLFQPLEVADSVSIAVAEGADVDLVDDRVLVPEHILLQWHNRVLHSGRSLRQLVAQYKKVLRSAVFLPRCYPIRYQLSAARRNLVYLL